MHQYIQDVKIDNIDLDTKTEVGFLQFSTFLHLNVIVSRRHYI